LVWQSLPTALTLNKKVVGEEHQQRQKLAELHLNYETVAPYKTCQVSENLTGLPRIVAVKK